MEQPTQYVKKINILLAEDDADEQYLFESAVKKLPLVTNVVVVSDGVQLTDYLFHSDAIPPDVIFLDIMMPRKDGLESLKEIRGNMLLKFTPIIMYSNLVEEHFLSQCYESGASYFLSKGDYNQLSACLERLLFMVLTVPGQGSFDQFKFILNRENQSRPKTSAHD